MRLYDSKGRAHEVTKVGRKYWYTEGLRVEKATMMGWDSAGYCRLFWRSREDLRDYTEKRRLVSCLCDTFKVFDTRRFSLAQLRAAAKALGLEDT